MKNKTRDWAHYKQAFDPKDPFAKSPTMQHLVDSLNEGVDIGDYGRLAFVMTARHFLEHDEMVRMLRRQPGIGDWEAGALIHEIEVHDYIPPTESQLIEWQSYQDFQICTGDSCNLYRELDFPKRVREKIAKVEKMAPHSQN